MNLTREQEEAMVKQYDRIIWSIVHRFRRRNASSFDNLEDLHQECMLVFVRAIRESDTVENFRLPIRDMIHAMCCFTLGQQTLSYPKRTSDFTKRMSGMKAPVDFADLDTKPLMGNDPINNAFGAMYFRDFINTLDAEESQIVKLKLGGLTNREVARVIGVPDCRVTRRLQRVKNKYFKGSAC